MYHLNQFFVIFLLSFILIEKITKKKYNENGRLSIYSIEYDYSET